MLFKVEYIQKVEGQDPDVLGQEIIEEPNLDAAKGKAARRLKHSQIAEHIPAGAVVTFPR